MSALFKVGDYYCPDHPGPLDDARDHVCRLRPNPDAESTSAKLRRVEQERDTLRLVVAVAACINRGNERDRLHAELASARTELDAVRTARDNLDRARSWVVARDGGRDCARCEQEIRRGEAYELTAGVDQLVHIHCRNGSEER